MEKFQKILVAFDLSEHACQALAAGCHLARKFGAELVVASVINHKDVRDAALALHSVEGDPAALEMFVETQKVHRVQKISLLVDSVGQGVTVKTVFRTGIPFDELVQVIRTERVDLVLMGPKGRSNLARLRHGSTAEKMFRDCPVSLLCVRTEVQNRKRKNI